MLLTGRTTLTAAAILLVGSFSATSHVAAADLLRTVAITGTQIHTQGTDSRLTDLQSQITPVLNNWGQTAFHATFDQAGINRTAIFAESGGNGLRVVASQTTQKTDGGFVRPFFLQSFNDQGQTAYLEVFPPILTTGQNLALYRNTGDGQTAPVALTATSEEPGFVFTQLFSMTLSESKNSASMSADGRVVFPARASDDWPGGNRYLGVWRENPAGGLDRVFRIGKPAPGTTGDFGFIREPPSVVVNRNGQIAFSAVPTSGFEGIWTEQDESLSLRVRSGETAPGTGGATFVSVGSTFPLAFNSQNHLAFFAGLIGPGADGTNNASLWRMRTAGAELIARKGDQAVGATPGQTYWEFRAQVLNARGNVAFIADTRGPDGTLKFGLWSDAAGDGLQLLAYPGISAPDAGPGVVFDSIMTAFPGSTQSTPLVLNAHGQAAFMSSISGMGVDDSNDFGIWAQDRAGILRLIARRGDTINVSDDPLHPDLRTISGLLLNGASGNDDGRRSWFNDHGQLAFLATFTDGSSGLFVSNLAAVPEPNALVILLFAVAVHGQIGRSHRK